jgi:hypothetical protein
VGVAGAATSFAQVYSINTVGYVNTVTKPGFNMIANPLDNKAGNKVSDLFAGVPDGTTLFKYTGGGYENPNAYDSFFGGWGDPNQPLVPGEGVFLQLPAGADRTLTFVGEVKQGHLVTPLPAGFAMVSSQVPQAGLLATDLKYPAADGDNIFTYANPGGYSVYNYDSLFGGWSPNEPTIGVGQAFWSQKVAAAQWVRDFTVN